MMTPIYVYQDKAHSNLGEREAPRELPSLLSLIDQAAGEQHVTSHIAGLASQVIRRVSQQFPLTTASLLGENERGSEEQAFAEQAYSALTTYLQQGFRRLLLIPWGDQRSIGSLLELARRVLSTATGETVSAREMTLPHVHVDGISVRGAFEGYVSIQAQLSPLMGAFPGWERTWIRLSAGDMRVVLLSTNTRTAQQSRNVAWEKPTIKALTAALCSQHAGFMRASERSRWQSDGEIYANYLVSLLSAATDFLRQEYE